MGKVAKALAALALGAVTAYLFPRRKTPSLPVGESSYFLEDGSGTCRDSIPVYYYKPATWTEEQPVFIAFPGYTRKAEQFEKHLEDLAVRYNMLIACPEFSTKKYPGARWYQEGNISDAEGEKMCREYAKKFYDLLGDAVYDEDVAGLEETLVRTLKEKGLTLSTAESCPGGLIAQRITSVPGSSEVFGYGFVTYWEAAKARLVGVEPDVIAKYNVVSAPVAAQMALGAAQAAGAEIGISVTGVAGPTGGDALRPVGTVYLGAARGETVYLKKLSVSRPDRALVRARAAQAALELALRLAQGKVPAGTEPLARDAQHSAEALDKLNEVFLGH